MADDFDASDGRLLFAMSFFNGVSFVACLAVLLVAFVYRFTGYERAPGSAARAGRRPGFLTFK